MPNIGETTTLKLAMILNQPARSSNSNPRESEDLRLSLGQQQLAEIVREAVPSRPDRVLIAESSEHLLALLTYSYAAGVYNSAEIPRELDQNDLLGMLGTPMPMDHHVLRRYRRQNRSALHDCLSRVLRQARVVSSPSDQADPSCQATLPSSRWSMEGNDDFAAEADQRINRAIQTDTFALDD